jgi:hypothetical protein
MAFPLLKRRRMNTGIRKAALVAYVGICVYLVAQSSPNRLATRADFLDKQLSGRDRVAAARALASALDMPAGEIQVFLDAPNSKPSDLVFEEFLKKRGVSCGGKAGRDVFARAGIPASEAVTFFDDVERVVASAILPATSQVEVVAKPKEKSPTHALAESLRPQPD